MPWPRPSNTKTGTDLRLQETTASAHREAVNRLAQRLLRSARVIEQVPVSTAQGVRTENPEPEGLLEILAKGEQALPRTTDSLNEINEILQQVSDIANKSTQDIQEADRRGQGFQGRLTIAQRLAGELTEPAQRIQAKAREYAAALLDVDPMVRALLEELQNDPEQEAQPELATFYESLNTLVESGRGMVAGMETLIATLEGSTRLSRALRPPLRTIQDAIRSVVDGQALLEGWHRLIRDIETTASGA